MLTGFNLPGIIFLGLTRYWSRVSAVHVIPLVVLAFVYEYPSAMPAGRPSSP